MQVTSRIQTLCICAITALILPACATQVSELEPTVTQPLIVKTDSKIAMSVVSSDFVNAMRQIPSLEPALSTVQLLRTQMDDGLIQAFKSTLEQAGYGVRWVGQPDANNLLQYRREEIQAESGAEQIRLDVALGDVELRRTYSGLHIDQIQPVTPLYVRGADATHVVLDDAEFFGSDSIATIEAGPLSVPENINPLSGLVTSVSTANSLTTSTIAPTQAENVFDLGGSNYASALSEHDVVVEQVLTFPNDSLRMGGTNKRLLNELVTRFDPKTDLFSVIGCSLGPTKLKSGNAALALGRASRVREALLFAGVDQHKILDEGCWAGDSPSSTLPRRGVVVTLNRQQASEL